MPVHDTPAALGENAPASHDVPGLSILVTPSRTLVSGDPMLITTNETTSIPPMVSTANSSWLRVDRLTSNIDNSAHTTRPNAKSQNQLTGSASPSTEATSEDVKNPKPAITAPPRIKNAAA